MTTINKEDELHVEPEFHPLNNEWCLWGHLPHNTDWGINSYIKIATFTQRLLYAVKTYSLYAYTGLCCVITTYYNYNPKVFRGIRVIHTICTVSNVHLSSM